MHTPARTTPSLPRIRKARSAGRTPLAAAARVVAVVARGACLAGLMLWAVAANGCGTTSAASLDYGDKARHAYADALDHFYDDECLQAEPAFRNVRRLYPYTRFAALAELRAADCLYKDAKYTEAIQAYEQFVRYRPSHVEVPYARFMVALSNYLQIPGEWLLSPATYEREQHYTRESLRLLSRFVVDYPHDPLVGRANRMAHHAIRLLAAHELYVARFYLRRDHPQAAVGRLRTLITAYPTSGYEPEALLLLGDTYLELKNWSEAKKAFAEITQRFPKSAEVDTARNRLQRLGS
jgi:outer membrane protein assembly factor BamD